MDEILKRLNLNQNGFSLIQVLVATGMMAIVSVGIVAMMTQMNRMQKSSSILFSIDQIRRNLSTQLSNSGNWKATVNGNSITTDTNAADSTLSCIATKFGQAKPNCTHDNNYPFKIYTAGGVLYFDPATQGFTVDGHVCAQGQANCVILLNLVMRTTCIPEGTPPVVPPNCAKPGSIFVTGTLAIAANIQQEWGIAFNPANYIVSILKEAEEADDSTTGNIRPFIGTVAHKGWVLANGGTIGNAGSGASLRANSDTQALFETLWNSIPNDSLAKVSGGRGSSSTSDWDSNKTIEVPDLRGRALFGKDDMGGAPIGRVTAAISGVNGTILGHAGGDQRMQTHAHPIPGFSTSHNNNCGCHGPGSIMWADNVWIEPSHYVAGAGNSQNMPPAYIVMYEIKL